MDDDVLCLDELYWTKIFNDFGFSVKCKGLGSKGKLKEFSKLIKTNTENVIVAMDRDYDDFYENLDDSHKIIYTYGYSFENDVIFGLNPKLVGSMFVNARNDNIFDYQMKQFLMKIEKDVKRAALIDIRYIKSPVALFDREKPLSIINFSKKNPPYLNVKIFMRHVIEAKAALPHDTPSPRNPVTCLGRRFFFGKAISYMVWQFFQTFSRAFSNSRNVNYEFFLSSAINGINFSAGNDDISNYYKEIFGRIGIYK